ncbi:MAG: helix-turn-helix transcriptional regulator [Clostridia bacterium]|nr:helix-turn-helix transcriptional regulator [Clostridia bacterium]
MKTVAISDVYQTELVLTEISVITQTPAWTSLGGLDTSHAPRKLNGFLLIQNGTCHYKWLGGEAELHANDLIYLPSGVRRHVSIIGDGGCTYYRVSFRTFDAVDGEELLFSEHPFVLKEVGQRFFELCEKMVTTTLSGKNNLKTLSCLYELLSAVEQKIEKSYDRRVLSAINYVEQHYNENFDVELLSDICFMSQPHLFRLFKKETGKTPIEYKIDLRIERAKSLLTDGECRIGEVAAMLGFESIYYFSRAFRKRTNMSPSEYQKKNR